MKRLENPQSNREAAQSNGALISDCITVFRILSNALASPGDSVDSNCLILLAKSRTDELIDKLMETEVLVSDHNAFAGPSVTRLSLSSLGPRSGAAGLRARRPGRGRRT